MDEVDPSTTAGRRPDSAGLLLRLGALVLVLCLAAAAVVRTSASRLDRATAARVETLRSGATGHAAEPITDDDLADLPDPVRRYVESVTEGGQPHVRTARLVQRGEIRLGGRDGTWKPFEATHDVAVDPPGFLWDATVALGPLLPARVVDAYEDGAGTLEATLLSTLPVASAGPSPEMDEGELQRYLAEAVWYPTALLGADVSWTAVDDRSARATLEDRGTTATLEFRFDDRGLVESVHAAERYRQEDDDYAPWTGRFHDYEERNGLVVPTAAEVAWEFPDGDLPYWRASIESIDHAFVE